MEEEKESQVKVTGNIFNKIIGETFPNLKKRERSIKVNEAYRTPNRSEKKVAHHIIIKTLNMQKKECF